MLKVVILEDDAAAAGSLAHMMRSLGHKVCGVASEVARMASLLEQYRPDLVSIDLNIGDRDNGIGIAVCLQAAAPLPVLFVTDAASEQQQDEIRSLEGAALVLKPMTLPQLRLGIALAVQRTRDAQQS